MDKEQILKLISDKLRQTEALIDECVALADEHGVVFHLPWGGEGTNQRGMGACYIGTSITDARTISAFSNDGDSTGWQPSAGSC